METKREQNKQNKPTAKDDEDLDLMKIVAAHASANGGDLTQAVGSAATTSTTASPAAAAAPPAARKHLEFFKKVDDHSKKNQPCVGITSSSLPASETESTSTNVQLSINHLATTTSTIPTVTAWSTPAQDEKEGVDTQQPSVNKHEYELISGLWVRLSQDAEIVFQKDDGALNLKVRAQSSSLGDSIFTAQDVRLKAKIVQVGTSKVQVENLVIMMGTLAVDPLITRDQVLAFLNNFGLPQEEDVEPNNTTNVVSDTNKRMTQEQWEQFLANAQNYTRLPPEETNVKLDQISTADENGIFKKLDLKIPQAQVRAVDCEVSSHKSTLSFPDCQGSDGATVRTLLEYYARSVLNEMDLRSGDKADVSLRAVASDVASVKASMVGATLGGILLGPAGFVAGSYFGSKLGRRHSTAVVGGALFGPVGLVAGAAADSGENKVGPLPKRPQPSNTTLIDESGQSTRSVVQAATDHVQNNKYEYAGSTGVVAGATVGMAIAGPIGLVAGSVMGSFSSCKLVEKTTSSNTAAPSKDNTSSDAKGYRFGDITRGIVARGQQSRDAKAGEGYRFGDFTRGLLNRRQGSGA